MSESPLAALYGHYIDCLNRRDWRALDQWVSVDVVHNARTLGLAGYRAMLEHDVAQIPDLRFNIQRLVVDAQSVAARLQFDCRPAGIFRGLAINGRRVVFHEHVIYAFADGRIQQVWSVIDPSEIAVQC